MDITPDKQVAVPEGAEQVGDVLLQQAAIGVGGGGTEAADTGTEPERETETVNSFNVQSFLTQGLTPTLNRISLGTQQPGPDSAQRETSIAQLRDNLETQTRVENNTTSNTVTPPEPQGEAQASSPLPSYAPTQLDGGA